MISAQEVPADNEQNIPTSETLVENQDFRIYLKAGVFDPLVDDELILPTELSSNADSELVFVQVNGAGGWLIFGSIIIFLLKVYQII